ncbi:hypothetical protein TrVFT333_002421 [Trichoderma virens FT-333]|nr:hypothetical protein TrVFT333_002421 [Trichoderma virens FT-333]
MTTNVLWNRMITAPFIDTYKSWSAKHKLAPMIDNIPNTSIQGFWVGNKDSAKYVMLYLHGGGFVYPGMVNHIDMIQLFVEWSGGDLAVFCPCYTLAPDEVYPTQIGQAVESLRYVLSLPSRLPETTLIGGDSAGGNLVFAVLSHISGHPHPQTSIVKPLESARPLKGAILIAPWVSSDGTKFESFHQFRNVDVVTTASANGFIEIYKGERKNIVDDEFTVPELAPGNWWSELKTSNLIITVGEFESLKDPVIAMVERLKESAKGVDVKLVIGKNEIHVAPLFPKPVRYQDQMGDDCQEAALRNWIKDKL